MKLVLLLSALFCMCASNLIHAAVECAGGSNGSGLAAQNKVLFVWAKTVDDASSFPSWTNTLSTTLTDFYAVMSYNQHTITTKVATKNGGFFVSDPGHNVDYYKSVFQSGQGYLGPYGIFVEEILQKVEAEYGAIYFDDVDIIMMMITDGGSGWYLAGNPNDYTGVGYLGVQYTTGNGKTFGYFDGVNSEFATGENTTEWIVCHEYGHFLGLEDLPTTIGTYSLMQNNKVNDSNEGVTPLSVKEVMDLGWLDINNAARVQTVTTSTTVTLKPLRSTSSIVAARVLVENDPYHYFLVANHQRATNIYDGTYPADGLLIWHIYGIDYDIECAVGIDPIVNGFNKDHLDLPKSDPNYHGEGLASDFFTPSGQNQFTPWSNPSTDWFSSYDWFPTFINITNITSSGNTISFLAQSNYYPPEVLTVDSWWREQVTLNGNVTVNSGKTLTILAGTDVIITYTAISCVLDIFGTLNIAGSAVNPITFIRYTSPWYGIKFRSSSSGAINYAIIDNVQKGVHLINTNNVTVSNCTIRNFTEHGVHLNGSGATIQNCTITQPAGAPYGIQILGSGNNPNILNNTIDGTTYGIGRGTAGGLANISGNDITGCETGIRTYQSAPVIVNNRISHNNTQAILVAASSSPDIHDNEMVDNDIGIYLEQSQPSRLKWNAFSFNPSGSVHADYLLAGNTFADYQANNFDNLVGSGYDVVNNTSVTFNARGNYWVGPYYLGPLNASAPLGSPNPDAGPGGQTGKIVAEEEAPIHSVPQAFALAQSYPNPFSLHQNASNSVTRIRFDLPEPAEVEINIYDVQGKLVRTLAAGKNFAAGQMELHWNGEDNRGQAAASGIYLYRLTARSRSGNQRFTAMQKLTLMR